MDILSKLYKKIIVSTQASPDEPLYEENCMIALMKTVVMGGCAGLRLAGVRDVKNAKALFDIPVIGLTKPDKLPDNWKDIVYITPTLKEVQALIDANADIIAFDGTMRERKNCTLEEIILHIKNNNKLSMADISTFEEGINARELGADIISTTLSGYTQFSKNKTDEPDFKLLEQLVKELDCPIFLEGRIWNVEQVKKAFDLGAFSVVIGSAITRPHHITKKFTEWEK